MKKLIILSVSILLSVTFFVKAEGQTLTERQKVQIKNQVDSVFQKMVGYAEKLDFKQLSSGVDDTREAGFITNGKYYDRYSTLIDDVVLNAQGVNKQYIFVKEKKITVLSDSLVLLIASGTAKALLDDGREISGIFQWSFIYEKTGKQWKVIYSHQSSGR